jgi:TonB family protein
MPNEFAVIALAAFAFCGLRAHAQQGSARDPLRQLAAATSLNRAGMQPWHLRVSFVLYAIDGSHQGEGTLEEWWVAPHRHRVVIASQSFRDVEPAGPDVSTTLTREVFLVHQLRQSLVHPVMDFMRDDGPVKQSKLEYDSIPLSCFSSRSTLIEQQCVEADTGKLRLTMGAGGLLELRNHLATFHGTEIAWDEAISCAAKLAITGHIETLESFDPTVHPMEFTTADNDSDYDPGDDITLRLVKRALPKFPDSVREEGIHGFVIVGVIIGKDGRVRSTALIASPSPALNDPSVEAVRKGVFAARKRGDIPVQVEVGFIIEL